MEELKEELQQLREELEELKKLKLGIVYMGLESGDDEILIKIDKKIDSRQMIDAAIRVKEAGILTSIMVILGLGGVEKSETHALATIKALNEMDPDYVGALSLMLIPGTPMYEDYASGIFTLIEPDEMLRELRTMIAHTHLSRGLFHANHPSNYLPIKARLPKDKEATLKLIDKALDGKVALRPEWLRAL